jgi:hypothetical protein
MAFEELFAREDRIGPLSSHALLSILHGVPVDEPVVYPQAVMS